MMRMIVASTRAWPKQAAHPRRMDIFLTLDAYAERFGDPGRGRHVRSYERHDFLRRAAYDFHALVVEALFRVGPYEHAADFLVQPFDDRVRRARRRKNPRRRRRLVSGKVSRLRNSRQSGR